MRDVDIHAGDVLRVRRWEDMEAEYGLNRDGDIGNKDERDDKGRMSEEIFTSLMRPLCGKTFTVSEIHTYMTMVNDYRAEEPEFAGFVFEAWMLEPLPCDEKLEPMEPDALFGFLLA